MLLSRSAQHRKPDCFRHVGRSDFTKRLVLCTGSVVLVSLLIGNLFSRDFFSSTHDPRYNILIALLLISLLISVSIIFMAPHIVGRLRDMGASPSWVAIWPTLILLAAFIPGPGPGVSALMLFGGLTLLLLAPGKNG